MATGHAYRVSILGGKPQEKFLREHACDEMQGFLFSKAVPPDEVGLLLSEAGRHVAAA